MILGHFSTTGEAKIGIGFSDNSSGNRLFWFPRIRFDDGVVTGPSTSAGLIELFTPTWSYLWDSDGGIFGIALFAVPLDGQTQTIDLAPDKKATGLSQRVS